MNWNRLKRWEKVATTVTAIGGAGSVLAGVVFFLIKAVTVPVLYMERTQNSICWLSNRVDEVSYKQDVIIEMLQDKKVASTYTNWGKVRYTP